MPEKILSGWPEGTEIKKTDGKKEIILPEATDMNEFSRKEISEKVRAAQSAEETKPLSGKSQFSYQREGIHPDSRNAGRPLKVNRHHVEISKSKNQERKFREQQKRVGADNYANIWDRDR